LRLYLITHQCAFLSRLDDIQRFALMVCNSFGIDDIQGYALICLQKCGIIPLKGMILWLKTIY